MSAWIVSKQHIDCLVRVALEGASDGEAGCGTLRWKIDPSRPGYDSANIRELDPAARNYRPMTPSELGDMLTTECVRSVSCRYPSDDVSAGELPGPCDPYYLKPYAYPRATVRHLTSVEALKQIDCYGYQSCEHDGWESSEAFSFCEALKGMLCGRLPGYNAAPWGI